MKKTEACQIKKVQTQCDKEGQVSDSQCFWNEGLGKNGQKT